MQKSPHEPEAEVMSASDVWNDALQLADVLRQNLLGAEPMPSVSIMCGTESAGELGYSSQREAARCSTYVALNPETGTTTHCS